MCTIITRCKYTRPKWTDTAKRTKNRYTKCARLQVIPGLLPHRPPPLHPCETSTSTRRRSLINNNYHDDPLLRYSPVPFDKRNHTRQRDHHLHRPSSYGVDLTRRRPLHRHFSQAETGIAALPYTARNGLEANASEPSMNSETA